MKTKRTVSAGLIVMICFFIYNFGKDIYKIGIKDGKATAAKQVAGTR